MADRTPNPALRRRIEIGLRLASPLLDLAIAIGERCSRLTLPDDRSPLPARIVRDGEAAPRALRPRA